MAKIKTTVYPDSIKEGVLDSEWGSECLASP